MNQGYFAIGVFFLLACVTGLVLTALIRELAPRIGLTDRPDGYRKLHGASTPLGGGVAILLATVSVLGVVLIQPNWFRQFFWKNWTELSPLVSSLLLAGTVIVVVGLVDDRFGLRGWHKLTGQIIAAAILIHSGLVIHGVGVFGNEIRLEWFAVPVTLFWLLGAVNALNLLDGIDGLATMMGIILVSTIAMMGIQTGHPEVVIIGFVFAGSLVGFLRFNFPPASIFLGDTGSMLIGLVVGALAIQGSLKGAGTVLLAAPLAIWAIPIFDSATAILRRKLTGRSIYTTDRGHLHHRLLNLLGSNRRVLAWLAGCCALTSMAALLSLFLKNDLIALLTCLAIVIIFVASGVFGRTELLLLGSRLRRVGLSLVNPISSKHPTARESVVRLQGSLHWELLWAAVIESAERMCLVEVRLDVNSPAEQEGYHASWEQVVKNERERCWRMEFPLLIAGRPIGRLLIVGHRSENSSCWGIQQLMEMVRPFEIQLLAISERKASHAATEADREALTRNGGQNDSVLSEKHTG